MSRRSVHAVLRLVLLALFGCTSSSGRAGRDVPTPTAVVTTLPSNASSATAPVRADVVVEPECAVADATLRAVDAATGQTTWSSCAYGEAGVFLVAADDSSAFAAVYTTDTDSRFVAFDPADGRERWSAQIAGTPASDTRWWRASGPFDGGGTVVIEVAPDVVAGFDSTTGTELWRQPARGVIAHSDRTVVLSMATATDGLAIAGIDRATGVERWRFDDAATSGVYTPTVAGSTLLVRTQNPVGAVALDIETSEVRWRDGVWIGPAVGIGDVFAATSRTSAADAAVAQVGIAATSSEVVWTARGSPSALLAPVGGADGLALYDSLSSVTAVDVTDGSEPWPPVAGGFSHAGAGRLYTLSLPDVITAYSLTDGSRLWLITM